MDSQNIPTQRHPHPSSLHRFARDEDGSMIVFGLILFTIMLMIGGLAVDLMRFESTRTALQQSTDRCVLAAASFTQALEPEDVVNDCMEKADKAEYLTGIVVDEGLNYREVTATATAATNPLFMHLMGIDELDAPAASKAEQRITNVEIALVLDVSGSMVQNGSRKLANLKSAAKEFVETLLARDLNNRISIAIVPYNGQVNLPPNLLAKYNTVYPNGTTGSNVSNMYCIDLPASVYSTPGMSRTVALPMTSNADTFSSTYTYDGINSTTEDYASPALGNRWCQPTSGNFVRLPTNNIARLKANIDGLVGDGATSINAGMKWGLALLDPSARTMFGDFVRAGSIPAAFNGRPFEYDDDEAMKVIVVMTDGEHFAEERVNEAYKSGASPIYRSTDGKRLSYKLSNGKYYWPSNDRSDNNSPDNNGRSGTPAQQSWQQVWANYRASYIAWQLYARRLNQNSEYTEAMRAFRTQTPTESMDNQLQQVCSMAKDRDVLVFGIAFEAPPNGAEQIRNCTLTSKPTEVRFWDVDELDIQRAFRAIASQISYLRLTQ